jgi:hypothetical protein
LLDAVGMKQGEIIEKKKKTLGLDRKLLKPTAELMIHVQRRVNCT